jgi:hypothetical protein
VEQPNSRFVKETSILWTFFAFGPLLLLLFLLVAFFVESSPPNPVVASIKAHPMAWVFGYWLVSIVQSGIFSVHALRATVLAQSNRLPWVIGLAFASPVVAPFYWLRTLNR